LKVAHIVGINHLNLVRDKNFHLVLAHLLDESATYRNFYKEVGNEGAFLILDNSAFELGEPYPPEEMIKLGNEINASEIMAPEIYQDGRGTIEVVEEFAAKVKELTNKKWNIIATIHGKTFDDWMNCFKAIISINNITTIGLSCRAAEYFTDLRSSSVTTQRTFNRIGLTHILNKTCVGKFTPLRQYHLLGSTDPVLELTVQTKYDWIRSIDTSSAFAHGCQGINFGTRALATERIGDIDFNTPHDPHKIKTIVHNMRILDELAGEENDFTR